MTRHTRRRTTAILAAAAVALTAAVPGTARAGAAALADRYAAPGSNLLVNAGALSKRGRDAVTIPGWQIASGVGCGTPGFPPAADAGSRGSGHRLFAGGAGGTAELTQRVTLKPGSNAALPAGTRFRISGWFGGTATSRASLTVIFLSASGRRLGEETTGPVGGSGTTRRFDWAFKIKNGLAPAGTCAAEAELTLSTSLKNDDGPNAPQAGYDRAVAAGLLLSVSARRSGPGRSRSRSRSPRSGAPRSWSTTARTR